MRDHASELGSVLFDLDKGAAKFRLLRALREGFLQQAAEPVLLALNPEDVLNLLPSARARDLGVQKHAPHHFVASEAARVCEVLQVTCVRIGQADCDSMLEFPHLTSIGVTIALSRTNCFCVRANKPKALSASSSAERERKRVRREALAVLLADKTPPCPNKS